MENEELRKEISSDVTKWFEELDQYNSEPFLPAQAANHSRTRRFRRIMMSVIAKPLRIIVI